MAFSKACQKRLPRVLHLGDKLISFDPRTFVVCSPRGWQIGLSMSIWHGRFPYASSACLSPDPGHLNHRSRSWRLRSSRSASSHCWQWSRALRAAAQQMLSCSQPGGNSPRPKTDIKKRPWHICVAPFAVTGRKWLLVG